VGRKGIIIVFCTPMAAWLATGSTSSRQAKPRPQCRASDEKGGRGRLAGTGRDHPCSIVALVDGASVSSEDERRETKRRKGNCRDRLTDGHVDGLQ
jgi:hypothetical protein